VGEPETTRMGRGGGDKAPGWGPAAIGVLMASFLSAGGAAALGGSSTSASLVRVETQLEGLRDEQRRSADTMQSVVLRLDARDKDLDERLRAVELELARTRAGPR
jgi:hypothetical protein